MHIDLCFKLCIVVPDDVPYGPKHVAFIDDSTKYFLCLKVIYMAIIIQHDGLNTKRFVLHICVYAHKQEKYFMPNVRGLHKICCWVEEDGIVSDSLLHIMTQCARAI